MQGSAFFLKAKDMYLIRGDAVEGVLVAAPAPAQHRLGPAAQLHPRVRPHQLVPLPFRKVDVRLPGRESKLPWRGAGPPNHHDDKVDSDK